MAKPLISVVIPSFNHERFVAETLESAIAQDWRPLEIVVIDDGSTDGSYRIAKAFEQRVAPGLAIRVQRQDNRGVAAAFNRGIRLSRGELIAGIASDDYYLPDALGSSAARLLGGGRGAALVHSLVYLLDPQGRMISAEGGFSPATGRCLHGLLTRDAGIWAPTMMFRREAYEAVGGIDEALESEDYDFFVRLVAAGYEVVFNPRHTVVKRMTPGSLGADLRRWYPAPFRTLEKHRASLAPRQYRRMRVRLHLYAVRLAAGGGDLEAARWAISRLRQEAGPAAMARARLSVLRYRLLGLLPHRLRQALRALRRAARRRSAASRGTA